MGMIYELDAIERATFFGPVVPAVSLRKPVSLVKPSDRMGAFERTVVARLLRNNDMRKLHILFKVQTMGKVNA